MGTYRLVGNEGVYVPSREEQEALTYIEINRLRYQAIKEKHQAMTALARNAADLAAANEWFDKAFEKAEEAEAQQAAQAAQRRQMSTHEQRYAAAQAALETGLQKALAAITQLDLDLAEEKILPGWHAKERARLLAEARDADAAAGKAYQQYVAGARADAARLRAQAAVGDPQAVMADELLRARLLTEPHDGAHYADQARAMLDAGQPARAALLLEVAQAKGSRVTSDLPAEIEAALDLSVPDRKQAREIEQAVEANAAKYSVARAQALASTLGIGPSGEVGTGSLSERTSANVAAKMGAHLAGAAPGA